MESFRETLAVAGAAATAAVSAAATVAIVATHAGRMPDALVYRAWALVLAAFAVALVGFAPARRSTSSLPQWAFVPAVAGCVIGAVLLFAGAGMRGDSSQGLIFPATVATVLVVIGLPLAAIAGWRHGVFSGLAALAVGLLPGAWALDLLTGGEAYGLPALVLASVVAGSAIGHARRR